MLTDLIHFEKLWFCIHGESSSGVNCPKHGIEHCRTCSLNYQPFYKENNEISCEQCHAGQFFDDYLGICVQLECQCPNGQAVIGKDCKHPGGQACNSCDSGFHLEHTMNGNQTSICVQNECKCKNGYPSAGQDCKKHGSYRCSSCVNNFYLKTRPTQSLCLPCEQGTHSDGSNVRIRW